MVVLAGADQKPRLNATTGPGTVRGLDEADTVFEVCVRPVEQGEVVGEAPVTHLFKPVDG